MWSFNWNEKLTPVERVKTSLRCMLKTSVGGVVDATCVVCCVDIALIYSEIDISYWNIVWLWYIVWLIHHIYICVGEWRIVVGESMWRLWPFGESTLEKLRPMGKTIKVFFLLCLCLICMQLVGMVTRTLIMHWVEVRTIEYCCYDSWSLCIHCCVWTLITPSEVCRLSVYSLSVGWKWVKDSMFFFSLMCFYKCIPSIYETDFWILFRSFWLWRGK